MHFLAQIDLAEVAAKIGATSLPNTGSLAFFAGATGSVIYVPQSSDRSPTYPPDDTPELAQSGGSPHWRSDLSGRLLYPCWPLDFTALELPPSSADEDDDDHTAAQVIAVERHFKRRHYNFSASLAFAGPPIPDWWQTAIHFADDLARAMGRVPEALRKEQSMLDWSREQVAQAHAKGPAGLKKAEASVAMYQARLAKARELEPAFSDFVAEVTSWTADRDPWALMTPEDRTRLSAYWARNPHFPEFTGYRGAVALEVLKDKMFKALPADDDASFQELPPAVRELIDQKRAPRPLWWHAALSFSSDLDVAATHGVRLASRSTREELEANREKLARLSSGGGLSSLLRVIDGKSKERDELEARIASSEAKLAERRPLETAFQRFVQETSAWCDGRDPFSFMTPADIEQLSARLQRAAQEFRDFTRVYARTRIEELEAATLRVLATAENQAYATLPEQVRVLINHEYLLPVGGWHQMFGRGLEIQGESSAMREEGYVMLLQLTYDDMMHWDFGDGGAYQFWISPDNLAKRDWNAVKMTFECH